MDGMATVSDIIKMIATLSDKEKDELKLALTNGQPIPSSVNELATDNRFANGRVCPLCGSIHVVRNGHHADGTQRYLCRDCKKSFVATTNSVVSGTRKSLSVWERYICCMMLGLSIRKSAEACGIHRNTAFYWRHKILDALRSVSDGVKLEGIVEMDETFFPVSYKGNHKNSKSFKMPREPHLRGGETHKRGLSREQVCAPCAVDRNGDSIAKASNLGRVSTKNIHAVFDDKIDSDSTVVTDKMNSYVRFAHSCDLDLVQVKNGRGKKGIYDLQHINSYHSKLKKFMAKFNGVSTKHLNNYLAWSGFVNYAKETDDEKRNELLSIILTVPMRSVCREISSRSPLPA